MKANKGRHTCGFFLTLLEHDVDFTVDNETNRVTLLSKQGTVEFHGSYELFEELVRRGYVNSGQ